MRTYREILEQDLPKYIAEKAIANVKLHYKESAEWFLNKENPEKQEVVAVLAGAFPWDETEEGDIFWIDLSIELTLQKLAKNATDDV